jgi:hypothetical protein
MEELAYERGDDLSFTKACKPSDDTMVESFKGGFRQECLGKR